MSEIRFVQNEHHSGCFHVLRGADYVGLGGVRFDSYAGTFFTAQELRAIADELDKRNGVKDEKQ